MNSIIVKPNQKLWDHNDLLTRFPPSNSANWKWQIHELSQNDLDSNRLFVANTDYPITDPWNRKLSTWQTEGTNTHNEWVLCDGDDDVNFDFYYRYASVQSKLVKLYLQMPL